MSITKGTILAGTGINDQICPVSPGVDGSLFECDSTQTYGVGKTTILKDGSGVNSINIFSRLLLDSTGATILDWSTGGIALGSGARIKSILSATASITFSSMLTFSQNDQTITVTGAAVNDSVFLGPPSAPTSGLAFDAFVSAANTVTIRAHNVTIATIAPSAQTFRVTVFHY